MPSVKTTLNNKAIIIFNLLLVVIFSYYTFSKNTNFLLFGLDGSYMIDMIRQQSKWGLVSYLGYTNNIFQSLGNIYFPINYLLTPAYLIPTLIYDVGFNKVLSYTIFSLEMFVCIYLFCINFKFTQGRAIVASWIAIVSMYPLFKLPIIYPIFCLIPQWSTGLAETLLIMILISRLGESVKISLISGILMVILLSHSAIAYPNWLMLSIPILVLSTIYFFFSLNNKFSRLLFFISLSCITLFLAIIGFFSYFIGLFTYTAAVFFPHDLLNHRTNWQNVFMVIAKGHSVASYLFGLGIIGAIVELFNSIKIRKVLAILFLSYLVFLSIAGYIIVNIYPNWQGPVPLYFEIAIWPLYAVYAANMLLYIFELITKIPLKFFLILNRSRAISFLFPIAICTAFLIKIHTGSNNYSDNSQYPPAKPPVIDILNEKIGLATSKEFRGRVATFNGLNLEKAHWFDLCAIDNKQSLSYGNDFRLLGFNYYDIPTLFEYSQFISPAFYLFTKKFLSAPQDQQMRNVMVLRKLDSKILKLLGVKYFITDMKIVTEARLVYQSNEPPIFLYELENVNIGQYSPINHLVIKNSDLLLDKMAAADFDPQNTVIVDKEISEPLVAATDSVLQVKNGGNLNISSQSEGYSMLILPIEYSNCLEIMNDDNSNAMLLRANLLQTGILFHGKLNVTIRYFTGLGHNSSCRLKDMQEAKAMQFSIAKD